MRTGYKLMPRGVSQPPLLHSGRISPLCLFACTQNLLSASLAPLNLLDTVLFFLYTAQASCLLKTHVLGFYFIMPYSSFLQLPTFPPFLSQLLFLSLLEFYFLLIGFLGCVNFLRCTLLLIFLYLIRCYWSPNAYYLFWMFWGKLGWAGFSAYPLSSAGPSN